MILRALFRLFTLALEIGEAWERFTAPPAPREPRPLLFGWCLDCGPEGTLERAAPGERLPARRGRRRPHVRFMPPDGRPTFVTPDWRCERCGSPSVMNIRAGGDSTVSA